MKRIMVLLLSIMVCTCCFGCSKKPVEFQGGIYVFENSGMLADPVFKIDKENQRFSFVYNMLSSYHPIGSYQIEDDVLVAATDDGKNIYRFQILDEETLCFLKEGSSIIPAIGETQAITDKVEFKHSDQTEKDLLAQRVQIEIEQDGILKYYICKLIEFSMHRFDRPFVDFDAHVEVLDHCIQITVPNLFYGILGMEDLYTKYPNHLELTIDVNESGTLENVEYNYYFYANGVYSAPTSSSPYDKFEVQFIEERNSNHETNLLFSDCGRGVYSMIFDDDNFKLLVNDEESSYYQKSLPDKGEKNVSIYYIAKVLQWDSDDFEERLDNLAHNLSNILIQTQ